MNDDENRRITRYRKENLSQLTACDFLETRGERLSNFETMIVTQEVDEHDEPVYHCDQLLELMAQQALTDTVNYVTNITFESGEEGAFIAYGTALRRKKEVEIEKGKCYEV